MKTERDVIQLAGSGLKTEQIAAKLKLTPKTVIKIGRRMGIRLSPPQLKQNGRRKAKRA
jgi:DNA-binding NarL/FixJ family response regulator